MRLVGRRLVLIGLALLLMLLQVPSTAAGQAKPPQGQWWVTEPEPDAAGDLGFVPYWQIGPRLREIETSSNRVKVEVIGNSVQGRDLFLVTVADPTAMGRLGRYQALRQLMIRDPEAAQRRLADFQDFKIPIYIHGSIHGNEYPGVDASLELIERLAFEDDPETRLILDNAILMFNVVANPDGRVAGIRTNANGFDLNRDFITQSQPETKATVEVLTEWNPMVVLDQHGFVNPFLIEPTTPPHNHNYEYDLYIKWALPQAQAMETELAERMGLPAQIPFRDFAEGWDDWPPVFTPMYAMYHGSYGHTLETPFRNATGVDAHFWVTWGAFKFASENRVGMIHDQIEIFRRGFLDLDQVSIADEFGERHDFIAEFPTAFVIPVGAGQRSDIEAARLVDFLLANDVQVQRATRPFQAGDQQFDAGSYLVFMDQPKRGLANVTLGPGFDISDVVSVLFTPPAAWSNGLLWGADVMEVDRDTPFSAPQATPVQSTRVQGGVDAGTATAYALPLDSRAAVEATNLLLGEGLALEVASEAFDSSTGTLAPGTVLIPADARTRLNQLAAQTGLRFRAVPALPDTREDLRPARIAARASAFEAWALRELGFSVDLVTAGGINSGAVDLSQYDVLLVTQTNLWNQLNTTGRDRVAAFFEGGGGLVGTRVGGSQFALASGQLPVEFDATSGSGIVNLDYASDSPVVGGYPGSDTALVETPVRYTSVSDSVAVDASYAAQDFFVAGHWRDREAFAGQPVVLRGTGTVGDARVVLFGIDPLFRAHPERTFPAVSSALLWTAAN